MNNSLAGFRYQKFVNCIILIVKTNKIQESQNIVNVHIDSYSRIKSCVLSNDFIIRIYLIMYQPIFGINYSRLKE